MDFAVDLGSIGLGAAGRAAGFLVDGVDQHVDRRADLARQFLGADARRQRHHALVALLLDVVGDLVGHRRRGRALDRLELERADPVELRFLEPGEQISEVLLGLAGEADHEADERIARSGTCSRQARMRCEHLRVVRRRRIARSTFGLACWNGMSR